MRELRQRSLTEASRRKLAQLHFGWFCEYVFDWEYGALDDPVVPMHTEWAEHIDWCWSQGMGAGILAPRDHGKTQQIARARMIWELGRSTERSLAWLPDLRIKLFQNIDENAVQTVELIREDIESNHRLQNTFPKLRPARGREWSKHKLYIQREKPTRDPSFEGRAILSSATSGRADVICYDDVCDLQNSVLEPATRKKISETIDNVVTNLGEPHTREVAIGTSWHEEDANAKLKKNSEWAWVEYKIQPVPGGPMVPLWPGKWDIPALQKRRRKIGERAFNLGFNQIAVTDHDSLVNWDDVKACMRPDLALGELPWRPRVSCVGYDLAISKRDQGAFFVAFGVGMNGAGQMCPMDGVRAKIPFRQQLATAQRLNFDLNPTPTHVVENNGYQEVMAEQLREMGCYMHVESFATGENKMDVYVGLPSLQPSFEARAWVIPTKDGHDGESRPDCECLICSWLREMRHFPASTSDVLMASWFAFHHLRAMRTQSIATAEVMDSEFVSEFGEPGHFVDD